MAAIGHESFPDIISFWRNDWRVKRDDSKVKDFMIFVMVHKKEKSISHKFLSMSPY